MTTYKNITELGTDWLIADTERDGKCVLDADLFNDASSDALLFWIPKELGAIRGSAGHSSRQNMEAVLNSFAIEITLARDKAFDTGRRAGMAAAKRDLHDALGVTELVRAIEIASEKHSDRLVEAIGVAGQRAAAGGAR